MCIYSNKQQYVIRFACSRVVVMSGVASMNIYRAIDYLLENGGNLLRCRLHRDVLHDLTPVEEENHLEGLRQSDDYKLLLPHIHENGYIGRGMHSWEKCKTSHLDDGESAARYIANTGIPADTPFVYNFAMTLRNDDVLEEEFSYYHPEKVRFANRNRGLNSGSWRRIFCAEKGPGRRPAIRPFSLEQNASPSGYLNSADISKGSNIPRTPPIANKGASDTPPALRFGKTTRLQPE